MTTTGVIREWHEDEGWGVVDAAETPGGCWAHFSAGAVPGYVVFEPGQPVHLDWESPGQDGFAFRATRLWPFGAEPVGKETTGPSAAYSSVLTLGFDGPGASPEPPAGSPSAGRG